MTSGEKQQPESLTREIGKDLAEEGRSWLRWFGGGALVGAVVLGFAGFYYFDVMGLAIGAGIGGVAGGFGALWLYLEGSTVT